MDQSTSIPVQEFLENLQSLNCRVHPRLTVQLEAICEIEDRRGSPYFCTVIVTSLSIHGASCIAPRSFARGTTLRLDLVNASRTVWQTRFARVIHERPAGESNWIMGCQFSNPLDDEQFRELVAPR